MGYWPGSLFKNMGTSADLVQWGGQVLNTAAGGQHSSIKIGSGHFSEGRKKAAFMDRCLYFNVQNQVMEWNGNAAFPHKDYSSGQVRSLMTYCV